MSAARISLWGSGVRGLRFQGLGLHQLLVLPWLRVLLNCLQPPVWCCAHCELQSTRPAAHTPAVGPQLSTPLCSSDDSQRSRGTAAAAAGAQAGCACVQRRGCTCGRGCQGCGRGCCPADKPWLRAFKMVDVAQRHKVWDYWGYGGVTMR